MVKIKPLSSIAEICSNYSKAIGKKSIIETLPAKIETVTNPIVMDAKAMLARINIEKPINRKEYKIFKEVIDNKLYDLHDEQLESILSQINPINSSNIDKLKKELILIFKDYYREEEIPIKLIEERVNGADRDDIFQAFKSRAVVELFDKKSDKLDALFIERAKLKKNKLDTPSKSTEEEYSKLYKSHTQRLIKLYSLFTPNSTKSEVIAIEEEVKKIGVKKVNFSDDIKKAQLIRQACIEMKRAGIEMPTSIVVTPLLPSYTNGTYDSILGRKMIKRYIYLNTSKEAEMLKLQDKGFYSDIKKINEFADASPELQTKYLKERLQKVTHSKSTKNLKHTIYHEVGHSFSGFSAKNLGVKLSSEEMEIAKEVSGYAASLKNGQETVAEMFAMLMDGQKLTDKQMALYLKLGGIVPQF